MATEKAALRITELDFLSIKENLKQYLRSQTEFQDFDFEGSGMSVLLDVLAYNTHYMGYYLNMVGNEMFLDSAQLRNSIISHAKLMNYVPGSRQGALSRININVTPSNTEDANTNSLTLEKYTRLLGQDIDGVNYPFVTLYSNTVSKTGQSFVFSNVYVKQGEVSTLQYLVDATNTNRRFEIPSQNVDTTSVVITVQESSSNTDVKLYTQATDLTEVTANSMVYWLEENDTQTYSFYFGDDHIGKRPKDGNIVTCTYLDNVGSISNNITGFTFVEPIGGEYSDNVNITSAVSSYGGVEKESVEQVKFRAPYFYTTQNRAVTQNDYETLILKDYNYIDSVSVWGGEDNDPIVYGKVFISLKTSGNFELTNFEKERIKEDLIQKRNVLTVTPEIIDPEYVFLLIEGNVTYNSQLTSLDDSALNSLVRAAIQDYISDELNRFSSTFRKSKLQQYIENCEPSITGSDIDVYVQKRILIDTVNTRTYIIKYNMPLRQSPHKNKLTTFPELQVFDAAGVSRNAFIEEVPEALTGIDRIEILDGGRNYISAPTVTINGDGNGATATASILGGRIDKITITNPGTDYSYAIVTISGGEGYGAITSVKLQSEEGVLRTFYYKTNGEKVIINQNAGTIDYNTGTIILNSLRATGLTDNAFYPDDYLTINIQADEDIIYPLRNKILTLDTNDSKSIQITMVAEG
jgi:hypothetical protein